jgi:hypothetical protein
VRTAAAAAAATAAATAAAASCGCDRCPFDAGGNASAAQLDSDAAAQRCCVAAALKMATRWTRCLAVAYLAGVRAFVAPYAQSCCVRSNSALACTTAKATEAPADTLFEMPRQTDEMVAQAAGEHVCVLQKLLLHFRLGATTLNHACFSEYKCFIMLSNAVSIQLQLHILRAQVLMRCVTANACLFYCRRCETSNGSRL